VSETGQNISGEQVLQVGLKQKAEEFAEAGVEIYSKA
jgi:hypothetical protein